MSAVSAVGTHAANFLSQATAPKRAPEGSKGEERGESPAAEAAEKAHSSSSSRVDVRA
jgi:hypothetical protein